MSALNSKRDTRELPSPYCHVRKMATYELESRSSQDIESAPALILDFLASKMEKSTSALYKLPSLWNPVIAAGLDGTDKILIPGASECEHSWR